MGRLALMGQPTVARIRKRMASVIWFARLPGKLRADIWRRAATLPPALSRQRKLRMVWGACVTRLPDPPLTLAETAAWLNYHPATVRRLIKSRKLIATKAGGQWRISRKSLLEYLEMESDL